MQTAKSISENQQKFDVYYYKLELEAFPDEERIKGSVVVNANVIDGPLNVAEIDLVATMQVDSVIMSGTATSFTHDNDLLKVDLDQSYQSDESISFTIFYQGIPELVDGFRGFLFSTHNNKPIFWTSSDPFEARTWWPCKDTPEDKADSIDIVITVPEGMIVASNGLLSDKITSNGKTTFYWKERYPIATYLVSLAAYEYKLYSDQYISLSGDTMSIDFYIFPEHYDNIEFRNNYAKTKTVIKAFAGYFGEYPFVKEKYGHAEWGFFASMEHQTCTSLGSYDLGSISHELSHQWWGDMVTCRDFHHIWLNEGFATYCEALWREYDEGISAYHQEMSSNIYKGGGTIYVDDLTNFWRLFNSNTTYRKPSYVLHMLRHVVGDSTFFDILHSYYNDSRYQYGTAVTEDFQQVCEEISGLNLEKFFKQWIYGEYYPKYEYSWQADSVGTKYKINLEINQVQANTGLFWMPIDIRINTASGDTTVAVWDSLQSQQFEIYVYDEPIEIIPDKYWILGDFVDVTCIVLNDKNIPVKFTLMQNYPNPFNPKTVISYQLALNSEVDLSIYNLLGQKVSTLVSEKQPAGSYTVELNASGFASGIYIYRLETEQGFVQSRKMILLK